MATLETLTATELAALYRSGEVRPSEALAACLACHDRVNPVLNAVVALDREGAARAAEASGDRWAARKPLSPLDGVPITVKDNLKMAGLPATWGSVAFADHRPERDELAVARLHAAGAVLIGKTNTPELALAGYTSNALFGSTGNPWNPALTPGGSSGGAVAAVMSGIAPLALATDAGGSIRRPCGHTGAVGLRTTPGLVPRRGGFPALATDLQTIGPIARSVQDLTAMLGCLSGVPVPAEPPASLEGLRVGVVGRIAGHPVEAEILDRLSETAGRLRNFGAHVEEIPCPFDPVEAGELFMALASVGVAAALAEPLAQGFEPTPAIARLAKEGRATSGTDHCKTLWRIAEIRAEMADLFGELDFVLTPSTAAMPWPKDETFPKQIAGEEASPRGFGDLYGDCQRRRAPGPSLPGRAIIGGPAHRDAAHRATRGRCPPAGDRRFTRSARRVDNSTLPTLKVEKDCALVPGP